MRAFILGLIVAGFGDAAIGSDGQGKARFSAENYQKDVGGKGRPTQSLVLEETDQAVKGYLSKFGVAVDIIGRSPVRDAVPGVGRARKMISKDVQEKIERAEELYNNSKR